MNASVVKADTFLLLSDGLLGFFVTFFLFLYKVFHISVREYLLFAVVLTFKLSQEVQKELDFAL